MKSYLQLFSSCSPLSTLHSPLRKRYFPPNCPKKEKFLAAQSRLIGEVVRVFFFSLSLSLSFNIYIWNNRASKYRPIYTSYCSPEWRERLDDKVVTGYLNRQPFVRAKKFLPLLRQWWFGSLDLSEYSVVISSSGNGEAKFARADPDATHICYCHSPPHFYWRKLKKLIPIFFQ